MREHYYHHFFCVRCQGYTVHDAGTCTRCGRNKDLDVINDQALPESIEEPEDESRDTKK